MHMSTSSLVCHHSSTFLQENESSSLFKTGLIFELASAQPPIPSLAVNRAIGRSKSRDTCYSQVVSRNFDLYGNNLPLLDQVKTSRDHKETLENIKNIEKYEPCKREINGDLANLLTEVGLTVTSITGKGDDLDGISLSSCSGNEIIEDNSKVTVNKHEKHSRKHHKKLKGKKSRKQYKESMKNKVKNVDLPSVTKASVSKKTSGYKASDVSINLGANCTAIKIYQNQQQPRYYHQALGKVAKNGEYCKTVCKTLPIHSSSKPCRSASLLVTSKKNTTSNRNVSSGDASYTSVRANSPRVSLNRRSVSQATDNYINRITKIYQSQTQSGTVEVCGVDLPCAPPATPTPEQLKTHQYVPSLNDVMAQRAVKMRLEKMEKKEQKKIDKKKEEELKQEKIIQKDKLVEKRKKQRLEIYALNKIMTELENKKFKEFCEAKGIS